MCHQILIYDYDDADLVLPLANNEIKLIEVPFQSMIDSTFVVINSLAYRL